MQNKPDWEKRFDEKWDTLTKNGGFISYLTLNTHEPDAIKAFIAQELERQRREYIEVVEELANKTGRLDRFAERFIYVWLRCCAD